MELFLDSGNLEEIDYFLDLELIKGVTTTPTILAREKNINLNQTLLDLSNRVQLLHVEALGDTSDQILTEVTKLIELGLPKETTVFKIPISNEGLKACKKLSVDGYLVNIHLTYTSQQAYMALEAGASYVCPLVGRLQDQGGDGIGLLTAIVDIKQKYNYDSKVMFSSVRNSQHVKEALSVGVDAITVPGKILNSLADHHLTSIHINQFKKDYFNWS